MTEVLESTGCATAEATKNSIGKLLAQIKRYQERVRKHIDDNYAEFMTNQSAADLYLEQGESLLKEAEHLLMNTENDSTAALLESKASFAHCLTELREASLGLRVSYRILKLDDLFQCVEDANGSKDYLMVLDLLSKINSLIYSESGTDVDRVFKMLDCYEAITVKYQVQTAILTQNLQQRFERQVHFSEKMFPQAKCVIVQVDKDESQLQDTVMALFQVRYNPVNICDFLLENCLEPLISKPVSVEYSKDNGEYNQLKLSYSLKELAPSLRPSYKQVFENIELLLQCLAPINVCVSADQHVFGIIGEHIKKRLLRFLIDECLTHAIPETMDEFQESTLVEDTLLFEHMLVEVCLISAETDKELTEFTEKFENLFYNRISAKILDNAKALMQRDLQDMTEIAEKNTAEDVANNPFLFPRCMVSKGTLELVKLMERILRQTNEQSSEEHQNLLNLITTILKYYMMQVPTIHDKLLESIPQQSALFYNNCMFLAHWVAKNSDKGLPTFPSLVKSLQSTGNQYFNIQIAHQQGIIMEILKEFDLTGLQSIGQAPMRLLRQCLRQMELLKNVWLSVLPDNVYNRTFCDLLNAFCTEIIKRIMSLEDISEKVCTDLADLIEVIVEKAPLLFKEKHDVIHVKSWMKLEQLKMILKASMLEIVEQWCGGCGALTMNYTADEIRHLIRALFQNSDRRAHALAKIV